MNTGKTLFAQLMNFLPWTTFARYVKRYGGDYTQMVGHQIGRARVGRNVDKRRSERRARFARKRVGLAVSCDWSAVIATPIFSMVVRPGKFL